MLTYFMLNFLTKKKKFVFVHIPCVLSFFLAFTCVQKLVSLPANERVGITKNTEELKIPHGRHISISLPNPKPWFTYIPKK